MGYSGHILPIFWYYLKGIFIISHKYDALNMKMQIMKGCEYLLYLKILYNSADVIFLYWFQIPFYTH